MYAEAVTRNIQKKNGVNGLAVTRIINTGGTISALGSRECHPRGQSSSVPCAVSFYICISLAASPRSFARN